EAATAREVVLVVRRLLAVRAAMHAIALVVDGVELADRQSRAVLAELTRRPPAGPVLVVLAARDDDPLPHEVGPLPAVVVSPLGETARGMLIAKRLGVDEAGRDLLREVS